MMSNTATGHEHGPEFYELFHDVLCYNSSNGYGYAVWMHDLIDSVALEPA